jgi:hypothetical protein
MGLKYIADHIIDICENAVNSGSKDAILNIQEEGDNFFSFSVQDFGKGISKEKLELVMDPFYTEKKKKIKFGLGLPLLKYAAEQTGGGFTIKSENGTGTKVNAIFMTNNIDCQPIGNIPDALTIIFTMREKFYWKIQRTKNGESYEISTESVENILGKDFIFSPKKVKILTELINDMENSLGGDNGV